MRQTILFYFKGMLPKKAEARWMRLRCDQFFCEPNDKESRGIYKCIPLKSKGIATDNENQSTLETS